MSRRAACTLAGLTIFLVVLLLTSGVAFAAPTLSSPIVSSTGSHIETPILVSNEAFPSGAPAVVLASVDSQTDPLAGTVLARAYGGPLLLTSATSLNATVKAELVRLHPSNVFVIGLPSAVVDAVKAALPTLTDPSQITVLAGTDKYQTAALVAAEVKKKLSTVARVVIVPGDSYGSGLGAAALAAAKGWPVLLTPAAGPFPAAAARAIADLGATSGLEVGTTVDPGVSGFTVDKTIVGAISATDPDGRYDAATLVAEYAGAQGWVGFSHVALAPGSDFPEAECAAPYIAAENGVLLLATSSSLPASTSDLLEKYATKIDTVDFVGVGWPVFRLVKSLKSPRVTDLSATSGPVAGGGALAVTGTNLTGVTKVRVGKVDLPSSAWKIDSDTKITISSLPAGAGAGPVEVLAYNFWGVSRSNVKDVYSYVGEGPQVAGQRVVQEALKYVGVPYLWGGATPTTGFDCSGLVMYVYGKFGVTLPHYSGYQATKGAYVAKEDLLPGDLIFFYSPISHVGMYVGGGMMINSPRSSDLVTIENAFRSSYVTARRIIPPTTRFEQTDARLAYAGAWAAGSSTSASGRTYIAASTAGASVTVRFSGTSLTWLANKGPNCGKASVSLDGGDPVQVDLYTAAQSFKQPVWSTPSLPNGTHTVVIAWTGEKTPPSTGSYISIDAFDILGSLAAAATTATEHYEQNSGKLTYVGSWSTYTTPTASGGTYLCASARSGAIATFDGTRLDLIATKGVNQGKAKVTLDGESPVLVDLYSPSVLHEQKVWSTGTIAAGSHTVTIEWTGQTSSPTGANAINVDAFDIAGSLTQAPAVARTEDSDPLVAFVGAWLIGRPATASDGSYHVANSLGATVTIHFTGRYLAWIGRKSPLYGRAKITLDSGTPVTVDLYSSITLDQRRLWDTTLLAPGPHTVKIEWTGLKNAWASNRNVGLDAVDVIGTVN